MTVRGSETKVAIGLESAGYGLGVKSDVLYPLDFAGLNLPRDPGIVDSKANRGEAEAANYCITSEKYVGDMPVELYPAKGFAQLLKAVCGQVCTIQGKYHSRELVGYSNGVTVAFTPANTRKEEAAVLNSVTPADDMSADSQPANNVRLRFKFVASGENISGTLSVTGTMNGKASQTEVIDISVTDGNTAYYITDGFFSAIDSGGIDCSSCDDGSALVSATECRTRMFVNLSESDPSDYDASGTGSVTYGTAPTASELLASGTPADDTSLDTQPSVNSRIVIKVVSGDSAVAGNVYITGTRNGVANTQETIAVSQASPATAYYVTTGWFSAVDASGVDAAEINDGTGTLMTLLEAQDVFCDYEEVVSGVYSHKFLSNAGVDNRTLPSLIAYADRQTRVDKAVGVCVNTLAISGGSDSVLDAALGIVVKDKTHSGITYPTGLSYGETSGGLPLHPFEFNMFTWNVMDSTLQRQWVQDYEIESIDFSIDNAGEGRSTADGARTIRKFSPGRRMVGLTFDLEQESTKWFDRFEDVDELMYQLSCPTDQLIGSSAEYYRLEILVYRSILSSDDDGIGGAEDILMDALETKNYINSNEGEAFAIILTNGDSSV